MVLLSFLTGSHSRSGDELDVTRCQKKADGTGSARSRCHDGSAASNDVALPRPAHPCAWGTATGQ